MTIALPKYDDFMLPTLKAIRDLGGSGVDRRDTRSPDRKHGPYLGAVGLCIPKERRTHSPGSDELGTQLS